MPQENSLQRGFKSRAEKIAADYRKKLGVLPHEPFCGFKLAEHLGIRIETPNAVFPEGTNLDDLIGVPGKDRGWSALTMKTEENQLLIIHNHLHVPARQQSNIMHELAHVLCKHEYPETVANVRLPFFMRKYDKQQEDEAECLGSVLQITRDGLVWALKKRMSIEEMATHFNASAAMVNKRINFTGVKRQLSYLNS